MLISFFVYSKVSFKKYINPLSSIIIFILIFDILVLGIIFGNTKLIDRYNSTSLLSEAHRFGLHNFGIEQFKQFWIFGYGAGGFENVFKLFYNIKDNFVSHNAHNDLIELIGEIGLIGIMILMALSLVYFKKLIQNNV